MFFGGSVGIVMFIGIEMNERACDLCSEHAALCKICCMKRLHKILTPIITFNASHPFQ
jgi:hypothetical protein